MGCHSEREDVHDEGTHEQSRDAFTRALRALAQAEEDGKKLKSTNLLSN